MEYFMNYKFDIYDISNPKKTSLVASETTQSSALSAIAKLKKKSPDSRFVIKPEYDISSAT